LKILQLTRKVPFPVKDGESLAIDHMRRSMIKSGVEMSLLAMNTTKHLVDENKAKEYLSDYQQIQFVKIDNEVHIFDLLVNLIKRQSYHISRFVNRDFEAALSALLQMENFDVVQLESLYLAPYISTIRKFSKAHIALRSHNVEWQIWDRIEKSMNNPLKKLYLKEAVNQLKRYEMKAIQHVDSIVYISPYDIELFEKMGFTGNRYYYPIGIDLEKLKHQLPVFDRKELVLHFIGSLDWIPNQEGLQWFINKIWPAIFERIPQCKLKIAGRNIHSDFYSYSDHNIEIVGEVEDAVSFVQSTPISIVPLLSGGGMRAKIIEAMALGPLVISTTIGIEGIPAVHAQHAMIADTPNEFVQAISLLVDKPDLINIISSNARQLVESHFNVDVFSKGLLEFYRKQNSES
jgi:polysaccharide biosynthesis protein PslH